MESGGRIDINSPEFTTDDFRMYGLKVIDCSKRHSHDWTTCPFAHPNEKARRRDPRKVHYTGVFCPYIRQGQECPFGEHCPCSHNTFEYWLHPSRYRTQFCNIAASCNRNVCFFAHSIEELRVPSTTIINNNIDSTMPHQLNIMMTADQSLFMNHGNSIGGGGGGSRRDGGGSLDFGGVSFASQARQILDQLMTARQLSAARAPTDPLVCGDLSEINTLNGLILAQQRMAGISEANPISQSQFLNSLFAALFDEVCQISVNQIQDRERLMKLLRWMYIQVVQNRQRISGLFNDDNDDNSTMMTTNTAVLFEPPPSQQFRKSLSRIPETLEALPGPPLPPIHQIRSTTSFDGTGGMIPWTGRGRGGGIHHQMSVIPAPTTTVGGGHGGTNLRVSDESANTRVSGTTRASMSSLNRSSNESFQSFDRLGSSAVILSQNQFPSFVQTTGSGNQHNLLSSGTIMDQEDVSQIPEFLYADWMNQNPSCGHGRAPNAQ
eukprot:g6845.t1